MTLVCVFILRVKSQIFPVYLFFTEDIMLFVGCLTSQQHASASQGRISTDNFTCCHTEIEVTD